MALASDMASVRGRGAANQDWAGGYTPADPAWLADRGSCYVVSDGVGGAQAGSVASKLAGQTVLQWYYGAPAPSRADALRAALIAANDRVREAGAQNPAWHGMAATIVAAAMQGTSALICHLGDSRAYLVRGGQAHLLTRDHTWVQTMIDSGTLTPAEAGRHPYRHVITRYAGMGPAGWPDLSTVALWPGDTLVLCSDGVTDRVAAGELARFANRHIGGHPAVALVRRARQLGGVDDATAVVVRYEPRAADRRLASNPRPTGQAAVDRSRSGSRVMPGSTGQRRRLDHMAVAVTCLIAFISLFAALLSIAG